MEASGTSGMKAAINGTLNLSIRDGWWVEGFNHDNGWAFGDPNGQQDPDQEDLHDASAFYQILETEVAPLYYQRDEEGISRKWVERMRASISASLVAFSSHRMLSDYTRLAYIPLGGDQAGS
jgi:starch phosphorylase